MTNNGKATPSYLDEKPEEGVLGIIKRASDGGRWVVPLLGAGLSADAGIPVVSAIIRYLAKLHSFIQHRVYLPPPKGQASGELMDPIHQVYKQKPHLFLKHHGWPDRFQLNEDLLSHRPNEPAGDGSSSIITERIRDSLDAILDHLCRDRVEKLTNMIEDIAVAVKQVFGNEIEVPVDVELVKRVASILPLGENLDAALAAEFVGLRKQVLDSITPKVLKKLEPATALRTSDRGRRFDILGDWRALIRYFTNFNPHYADALFHRFTVGRRPAASHRFLAFLAKRLRLRLIFTFNFDPLIEVALQEEGVIHTTFEMEQGVELPDRAHVHDTLAVVKMHGGTHRMLLDERLDHPLSPVYLEQFESLTRDDPLLLLMGCSGERRVLDLVRHVIERNYPKGRGRPGPRVIWLQFEPRKLASVHSELLQAVGEEAAADRILFARVLNPGAFLAHLHAYLTSTHPAGHSPYLAHVQRPIGFTRPTGDLLKATPHPDHRNVVAFLPARDHDGQDKSTSAALASYVNENLMNYIPICVDLEERYSFDGVVGAIIDQCRNYDPAMAPSVLMVPPPPGRARSRGACVTGAAESDELRQADDRGSLIRAAETAALRVARALRRSRYIVALDGVETLVSHPTVHHGTLHGYSSAEKELRTAEKEWLITGLKFFLKKLIDLAPTFPDSILCLAYDRPKRRRPDCEGSSEDDDWLKNKIDELFKDLSEQWGVMCCSGTVAGSMPQGARIFTVSDKTAETAQKPAEAGDSVEPLKEEGLEGLADYVNLGDRPLMFKEYPLRAQLGLLTLSCFRRTRNLVALRLLLSGLLPPQPLDLAPEAADKLLQQYCDKGLLTRTEGGGYWIDGPLRDHLYALNTCFTSTQHISKAVSAGGKEKDRELAARQLFLLAVHHDRIGRYYYSDNFEQSKDSFAFFEHVYHRTSSIRFLAKLAWLGEQSGESERKKWLENWQRHFGDLGRHGDLRQILPANRSHGDNGSHANCIFWQQLTERRAHEICDLHQSWVRSEAVLRAHERAGQLVQWCDWIVENDLKRFSFGRFLTECELDPGRKVPGEGNVESQTTQYGCILRELRARCLYERGDYARCYQLMIDQLVPNRAEEVQEAFQRSEEERGGAIEELVAHSMQVDEADRTGQLHRWLTAADCLRQERPEEGREAAEALLEAVGTKLRELTTELEERRSARSEGRGEGGHPGPGWAGVTGTHAARLEQQVLQLELRRRYLEGEFEVSRHRIWAYLGDFRDFLKDTVSARSAAVSAADSGLAAVRHAERAAESHADPLLGRSLDVTLYRPYYPGMNVAR